MTIDLQSPDPKATNTAEWTVGWSRGRGCRQLADALGTSLSVRKDWTQACIEHKLDLLVTKRMPSFDIVPIAVPYDLNLDETRRVMAAIGDGPHSRLAAEIAATLSRHLGVPGELATVARPDTPEEEASQRLARLDVDVSRMQMRVIEAPTATSLVDDLSANTLLVLGAPGGSWLQRQLFGPGHRMRVAAPGGAVVVRHSPRRCYHLAEAPSGRVAGPHMPSREALRLFTGAILPIAESGCLIGIVRRKAMLGADSTAEIGDLMEPPVSVAAIEPAAAVDEIRDFLDGGPIPVVDGSGHLVGTILARSG